MSTVPLLDLQSLFPSFPVFNADRDIYWWFTQFELMTADCRLADKSRLLILKLGDRVKDRFALLPDYMRHDYSALKHQLQETYGTLINDRVYYAELINRKKRPTKTMLVYMHDIKQQVGKLIHCKESTYSKETNAFVMLFFMGYLLKYLCTINPCLNYYQLPCITRRHFEGLTLCKSCPCNLYECLMWELQALCIQIILTVSNLSSDVVLVVVNPAMLSVFAPI